MRESGGPEVFSDDSKYSRKSRETLSDSVDIPQLVPVSEGDQTAWFDLGSIS